MPNKLKQNLNLSRQSLWIRNGLLVSIACQSLFLFWFFPNNQAITVICLNLVVLDLDLYLQFSNFIQTKRKRQKALNELFHQQLFLNILLLVLHSTIGFISKGGLVSRPLWLNPWSENKWILMTYGIFLTLSYLLSRKK